MTADLPRIATAAPIGPAALGVTWRDGPSDRVDLTGWIAAGGPILAPLVDPALFATARLGDYGASVEWGEPDDDLAIDAVHLRRIAEEQRPFGAAEIVAWQAETGFSNREAADFLRVSLSAYNAYKAGTATVPGPIAMVCRAARRDPVIVHAHFRPRKAGRPRRAAEA